MTEKEYKYKLIFTSSKDTPSFRAAFEHACQTMRIMCNSKPELITRERFLELVEVGEIKPPTESQGFWWNDVTEGKLGFMVKSYYAGYTNDWDKCDSCMQDFESGYRAAMKAVAEAPQPKPKAKRKTRKYKETEKHCQA